jgi:predicted SAM-dependent methyltransferase
VSTQPPFDPSVWPARLNLGCGFDHRAGYLNVDFQAFHQPDLVADVSDLPMLPSDHYTEILAQDVLEHLPRKATAPTLAEWNRLLVPGGTLVLRVPSLFDLVDLFRRPENLHPDRQEDLMQFLFGTQAYAGDTHLTSFTRPLLERQLEREGFSPVNWALHDEWLFDIKAEKVGEATFHTRFVRFKPLLAQTDVDAFLDAAYTQILGRTPDEAGRYHFARVLRSGELDHRDVLVQLEESAEAQARSATSA